MKTRILYKIVLLMATLAASSLQIGIVHGQENCAVDPFSGGSVSSIKHTYKVNKSNLSNKNNHIKVAATTIIGQQGNVVLTYSVGHIRKLFDSKGRTVLINNGDSIQTSDQSAISLQTSDGSRLLIPSNSKVSLIQLSKMPIKIGLTQGRIENYVKSSQDNITQKNNNKGKTSYQIRTPAVTLSVRGTQFRVEHDSTTHTTLAGVSEGLVAAQKLGACAAPSLLPGTGLVATPNHMIVTSLLPAPDLSNFPTIIRGETLHARINPVEKAVRYHVQAGYDEKLLLFAQESYSTTPDISLSGLESGYYFIKLTAVDADGNEGLASIANVLYQPDIK